MLCREGLIIKNAQQSMFKNHYSLQCFLITICFKHQHRKYRSITQGQWNPGPSLVPCRLVVHSSGETGMKVTAPRSEPYSFSVPVMLCTSQSIKFTSGILKIFSIYVWLLYILVLDSVSIFANNSHSCRAEKRKVWF